MKKQMIIIGLFFALVYAQNYNVNEIISLNHQNQSFDVCYGEDNTSFKLADLNGEINDDGKYWVTVIELAATW